MVDKQLIKQRVGEFQQKEVPNETVFVDFEVEEIIENCLPKFEQNLLEWCNHEPLTEIKFLNDWSIKKILELYPKTCFSLALWVAKRYDGKDSGNVTRWFTRDIVI